MKTVWLKQTKDVYSKLFRTTATAAWNRSWRMIASFRNLSSEGREENERSINQSQTVEFLLSTEKARLTFQKFWKFEESSVDETGFLTLVRLDAKNTDAVDSLAKSIANKKYTLHSKNGNAEVSRHALQYQNVVEDSRWKIKGGCISQVSGETLKALLSLIFSQLISNAIYFLLSATLRAKRVSQEIFLSLWLKSSMAELMVHIEQNLSSFDSLEIGTLTFP